VSERRVRNIVQRMLEGEDFYTNFSPRISNTEIEEIEKKLDLKLQREHTAGAIAGPIAIYPLHKEEFEIKAKIYLRNSK